MKKEALMFETKANQKSEEKVSKAHWVEKLDEKLIKIIFSLSRANFTSVDSFYGGIVAQEVVKYTGKFTPFN